MHASVQGTPGCVDKADPAVLGFHVSEAVFPLIPRSFSKPHCSATRRTRPSDLCGLSWSATKIQIASESMSMCCLMCLTKSFLVRVGSMVGMITFPVTTSKVCNEAKCAVATVLKLLTLNQSRPRWQCGVAAFKGLDTGFFIDADDVALVREALSPCMFCRSFVHWHHTAPDPPAYPSRSASTDFVWTEIPPFRRRSMCLGEMDLTIPHFITSLASSGGVHRVTGHFLEGARRRQR